MDDIFQFRAHLPAPVMRREASSSADNRRKRPHREFRSRCVFAGRNVPASARISPGRSRSAGTRRLTTLSRRRIPESSQKTRRAALRLAGSRLVVASMRTSATHRRRSRQSRSISRSCKARNNFARAGARPFRKFRPAANAAAMRRLKLADAARDGAGKRALFMTEKFRLQKIFRNRGAVQRDEGTAGAARFAVNAAREHFLAGAGLAIDQDGGVGARHVPGAPLRSLPSASYAPSIHRSAI